MQSTTEVQVPSEVLYKPEQSDITAQLVQYIKENSFLEDDGHQCEYTKI